MKTNSKSWYFLIKMIKGYFLFNINDKYILNNTPNPVAIQFLFFFYSMLWIKLNFIPILVRIWEMPMQISPITEWPVLLCAFDQTQKFALKSYSHKKAFSLDSLTP